MQPSSVQQAQTQFWAGSAALSKMGFPVPCCGQGTPVAPLVFIPWPELSTQEKRIYRIQSVQNGLQGADHWFNATDITVPSIIYRDFSPFNNPLAFAFEMVPGQQGGNVFALRAFQTGEWVAPDPTCQRLVTRPLLDGSCWFNLFSM